MLPWDLLLDLFGPLDQLESVSSRPLGTLRITFDFMLSRDHDLPPLEEVHIKRITSLKAAGRSLRIDYRPYTQDIWLTTSDLLQQSPNSV
ncbi:hypothetical protein CVT26_003316 [Gymnopilus dilepis]|uniref:Uncharacterized protein n=1 Tax=Gymnopilus dilepis TaxID=231916 RepID=A0A409W2Q5_9AGAR|nr:hypothetical protein CVT26_003316 [Gymnopilus dilepis]